MTKMVGKKLLALMLLQMVLFSVASAADLQNYQKGWDAFNRNDRGGARNYFDQAAIDPETRADALLSLCLLDWSEEKLDAAFRDFCRFYETSDDPYPYLYALSGLSFIYESEDILPQDRIDFFEKIVGDPKMNGTLKAMLYERIGSHYQRLNNFSKAQGWFDRMGNVSSWQVLGTFDNTSGSGYSKDWGAVAKAKTTDKFQNKVDAEVRWYTPTCNKPNNWFYFDYSFILNNAIMYAQSFVTSPVAQEAFLRAGTSGSLKVWVNDALVAAVPEERNCDMDIYSCKVPLNQGVNRILVQIGQSEIDAANFMLRLTDAEANPLPSLTCSANYAEYKKTDNQAPLAVLPFFAEDYFLKKLAENPDNQLYQTMLSEIYLRNDKVYEATEILKKLEARAPASSFISSRLVDTYLRAKNQTDYDQECEKIKKTDPSSFYALQLKYNEAVRQEKYTEAESICRQAIDLYGASEKTDYWIIRDHAYQKRYQEMMVSAKELYTKYPSSFKYLNINYQIEKSKDPKSAIALVENFSRKYFSTEAMDLLSKAYIEQGNNEKGLEVLRKRIKILPYTTGYMDNLSSVLSDMQKYREALKVSDQMMAMAPYLSSVYNSRGYIYKNLKETENARESFKKAIYYNPVSYDSRTQLRLLENKKELSEYFPRFNLSELIAQAPKAADYPQDNSVVLLNDNRLIVYPEGAKEYHYEMAAKILNQSGIEKWKEYSIGYNGNSQKLIIDKAEVIKSNGNIIKAETDDDNYIVFTNLEVNDVLHLEYRIQDLSYGKLAKHFFNNFLFQYDSPSVKNRYCILAPKDKPFQYLVRGMDIKPGITDVEDMQLYQWGTENQPAIQNEPYMSTYLDIAPALFYSSIPDWKYISDWYRDLTYNKFDADFVLKETVAELLKGKENVSAFEKARIFYQYILENISYSNVSFMHSNFVPQKASRTITTRLGDCKDVSTLFVALCRESGIQANLVLISTRNYGNHTMPLPVVDFNHCIAQVSLDGKVYFLELTDNTLPFSAALAVDIHSEILPIPFAGETMGDKLMILETPVCPANLIKRSLRVTFSNNDMLIDHHSVFTAAEASMIRNSYRYVGSDEQFKQITQAVASGFDVPVKVKNLKFTNLDNLEDSLTVDYQIEISNALQDVAGMKLFRLPWTDRFTSLDIVAGEVRKYPLEWWAYTDYDQTVEEINIALPQGKKFVEIPKNITLECESTSYEQTVNARTQGKLMVRRVLQRKADQVIPQKYDAFRNFMRQVSESDNKQFAIQ